MRNRATCSEPDCIRTVHARRYCQWHYRKHRRNGTLPKQRPDALHVREKGGTLCAVCGRQLSIHGVTEWCYYEEREAHHARA